MAVGLDQIIDQYASFGPLLASFLANLLATFGDKGQLVVITLASRYDAKRVFVGAMAAFGLWSALEVAFGSYVTAFLPAGTITLITGGLFLGFGVLTLRDALAQFRATQLPWPLGPRHTSTDTDGGASVPSFVARFTRSYGAIVTSFVFIMFAEFGDKTQALTIALAGTFPDAPVSVFVGVVAALGIRTGIDAIIGERVEQYIPSRYVQVAAGLIFLAFGLAVFGVITETVLVGIVAVVVIAVLALVRHRR